MKTTQKFFPYAPTKQHLLSGKMQESKVETRFLVEKQNGCKFVRFPGVLQLLTNKFKI